jgi:hypothetical protein
MEFWVGWTIEGTAVELLVAAIIYLASNLRDPPTA